MSTSGTVPAPPLTESLATGVPGCRHSATHDFVGALAVWRPVLTPHIGLRAPIFRPQLSDYQMWTNRSRFSGTYAEVFKEVGRSGVS